MTFPLTQVLLVGDSAVGKSCLLMRFTADRFDEVTTSTIGKNRLASSGYAAAMAMLSCCCMHAGVDFRVKFLTINGKRVKLAVW